MGDIIRHVMKNSGKWPKSVKVFIVGCENQLGNEL